MILPKVTSSDAMLTVVIDLIASGDLANNRVPFSEQLKTRFVDRLPLIQLLL